MAIELNNLPDLLELKLLNENNPKYNSMSHLCRTDVIGKFTKFSNYFLPKDDWVYSVLNMTSNVSYCCLCYLHKITIL